MRYLTSALISLPLSKEDALAFGITGNTAECHASGLQRWLENHRSKPLSVKSQVGDKALKWQAEGWYIYLASPDLTEAIRGHELLESAAGILTDSILIPSTWRLRPREKYLDEPPPSSELVYLTENS